MEGKVTTSSWVAIRNGCPISCDILGSGATRVLCGDPKEEFEFQIDSEALREFVRVTTDALRAMDASYANEETS